MHDGAIKIAAGAMVVRATGNFFQLQRVLIHELKIHLAKTAILQGFFLLSMNPSLGIDMVALAPVMVTSPSDFHHNLVTYRSFCPPSQ
ncbi:hypothetical protein HED49_22970 [Ochrobactrum daejeonense]|nr:hypothetical protein [Brucella daejeonensis]